MRARSTRRGKTRALVLAERREGKGALECAAERVRACVCARTRDVPETATTPVAFLGKGMRTVAFGWTFRISQKRVRPNASGRRVGVGEAACSFFSVREARNIFKFFWVTPPFPRGARGRNDIAPVGASPRSSPSHERTITTRDERRCGRDAGDGVARAERLRRRGAAWRRR